MTISKLKIDNKEYSLSGGGVKVAELEVDIVDGEYVDFYLSNCPAIDFYKGVRIEFTDGQNTEVWVLNAYLNTQKETGAYTTFYATILFGDNEITKQFTYLIEEGIVDYISFRYNLNGSNAFIITRTVREMNTAYSETIAKLYYYETDKTTQRCEYEY